VDKEVLSQQEVDALLRAVNQESQAGSAGFTDELFRRAAAGLEHALDLLVEGGAEVSAAGWSMVGATGVVSRVEGRALWAEVEAVEGAAGSLAVAVPEAGALALVRAMLGGSGDETPVELADDHLAVLGEAIGQVAGGLASAWGTALGAKISLGAPRCRAVTLTEDLPGFLEGPGVAAGDYTVALPGGAQLAVYLLLSQTLVDSLEELAGAHQAGRPRGHKGAPAQDRPAPQGQRTVAEARFPAFDSGARAAEGRNIELIMDVPLSLTVELGRTRRLIREILGFSTGSVIELDRLAGEAVDILVNGKPIARGEVVVINENFGVRITEIVSPVERVQTLR